MKLTPAMEKCIVHWGEMGGRWGMNRSVAQIHALLYLAPEALTAETIAETLGVARSNVSNSLKELQNWGLVEVTQVLGDRRDFFVAKTDVWEMLTLIMDGRKHREIDPTVAMLKKCVGEASGDGETPAEVQKRMSNLLEFLDELSTWYERIKSVPVSALRKLMRMGAKVSKLVGG